MDLEKFVDGFHDYLEQTLTPFAERIKALEQKVAEQKSADPTQEFCDALIQGLSERA